MTGRDSPETGPTAIITLDGQPHYLGFRAAEIARLLVEEARAINREDLESLEIRANEAINPRAIDLRWVFRGRRRKY
jgi:hypothetical protein